MLERKNRADVTKDPEQETQCDTCVNRQENCKVAMSDSEDLKECCLELRKEMDDLKGRLKDLILNHPACAQGFSMSLLSDERDVLDNLTIAYRALEAAGMRLAKVCQPLDGGG